MPQDIAIKYSDSKADTPNIFVSESCWSELAAAMHPRDRVVHYVDGEPALEFVARNSKRVIRIVRQLKGREKGKMNQDFEDQKLATVGAGFDSAEDEASWVAYLDSAAAAHEAEQLERMAADSAYEDRKLERMLHNDNF